MNQNLMQKFFLLTAVILWMINPSAVLAEESAKMDAAAAVKAAEVQPVQPVYEVVATSQRKITAYNSDSSQTDSTPCLTATDFNLCQHDVEDSIAANFLDFGTKVRIPEIFGDRVFVVRDRMSVRYPNRVDVWLKDRKQAVSFGVQVAKIEVVKEVASATN